MALSSGLLMSTKQYSVIKPLLITSKRNHKGPVCKIPVRPKDIQSLTGKVALVTGGASGIGFVIAKELLKHGIKGVAISDINQEQGEFALLRLQTEFGPKRVIFTHTDVSSMTEFNASMKTTAETFQGFDILVNNAGMLDDHRWERTIQVNLVGVINGCILAMEDYIPKYKNGDSGVVMNVASIAGLQPIPTIPVYVSTKHALIGLGKCLSARFHYEATKTKIITICPGYYDTPLVGDYFKGRTLHKRSERVVYETMTDPTFPMQKVDIIAKSIIPILQRSSNGSCWVIDKNNVSEVYLPKIRDLKKLQSISD